MNELTRVKAPIANAKGLPNGCYVNPEMYQQEQDEIFTKGWAAIGFSHDVPEAGWVCPVEFMGQPLLITRNKAGEIQVFENVCRHRGMILVSEHKRLSGPITCIYHAWSYDLDGALRATPHLGGPDIHEHEEVNCASLALNKIDSAVWRNVIFVNLSGDAQPFDDYIAPLAQRWAEFDQPIYFGGEDSEFLLNVECNWKLAVENYCESYHLPSIHPGLNSYSRLEDHYNILDSDCHAGQGTWVYNPSISDDGRTFPAHDGLSEKWNKAAEYCALFPNVLFGVHKDHSFAILLLPAEQQKTVERCAIFYASEESTRAEFSDMRITNAAMWKEIFIEDIGVVEGMQKGRAGMRFDGGTFSPVMDTPTHHFHRWVAEKLTAGQ